MKLTKDKKILIIGLGVIGAAYADALTENGYTVYAITRSKETLDIAKEKGIIYNGINTPEKEFVEQADVVVFALYPHVFEEWIDSYQWMLKSGAVITDVTGVKTSVVYKIQDKLRDDVEFIPAHPMAGRESRGIQYADKNVFKKANYIITPTDKNTEGAIELCEDLAKVLGFEKISRLTPEKHDYMIAFLSQLTHVIAVSLMTASDDDSIYNYSGDSFRDLTRIANINDEMWSELFALNKEALIKEIDKFETQMYKMRKYIETSDKNGMREMMKQSTENKLAFDQKFQKNK